MGLNKKLSHGLVKLFVRTFVFLVLVLQFVLLTGCALIPVREGNNVLFMTLTEKDTAEIRDINKVPGFLGEGKEILRKQLVQYNYQYLDEKVVRPFAAQKKEVEVEIILFDNLKINLITESLKKNKKGVYIWEARPAAKFYSRAFISFNEYTAFGIIQVDNQIYEIMPAKGNFLTIIEYDSKRFPLEGPPIIPKKEMLKQMERSKPLAPPKLPDVDQNLKVLVVLSKPYKVFCDSWFPIDILPIVEAAYQSNLNKVFNAVQNTGIEANVVLTCSDYIPAGGDLENDLSGVQSDANIATLRNNTHADLVTLIVPKADYCGRGYYNYPLDAADSQWAFSVVKESCALSNFSFAHELGHNIGMQHDRITENDTTSTNCNFGSIFPIQINHLWQFNYEARSVMAYGSACDNCTRMGLYSNPLELDFGFINIGPMGQECSARPSGGEYLRSNNRQQLIDAVPTVSIFR